MPAENGCSRIHPQGSQIDIQQMLGLSVLASIPCAGGKKAGKYGCCRAYGAKERRPYQEKKRGAKAK